MSLIFSYLFWHYTRAYINIWGIFSNFLWATYRFFSVHLLIKTFFSPWHHLDDPYSEKFDPEQFLGTLIVNTLMRIVGMFMKFFVLLAAGICIVFILLALILTYVIWTFLPILSIYFIVKGFLEIF